MTIEAHGITKTFRAGSRAFSHAFRPSADR
jgi:hypothetical protein